MHKRNNSEKIEYVKLQLKNLKTLFFIIITLHRKLNYHKYKGVRFSMKGKKTKIRAFDISFKPFVFKMMTLY